MPVHQIYQGRCPWPKYLQHHPPWRPCTVQCQPTAHVNRLAKSKPRVSTRHFFVIKFLDWQFNWTVALMYIQCEFWGLNIKVMVFWGLLLCNLVDRYQWLRGTFSFHLQVSPECCYISSKVHHFPEGCNVNVYCFTIVLVNSAESLVCLK